MMSGYFWRIWAVLLVLSIVWLGACIKTSPPAEAQNGFAEVVKAKAFEVVDASGKTRAALTLAPNGSAGLGLDDASGNQRAMLILNPDGSPMLSLADASGKVRVGLGLKADGSLALVLADASGKVRAGLGLSTDGSPGLDLLDASGEFLFSAP